MKSNKYDAYSKTAKVVESCMSRLQIVAARRMADNFSMMYKDNYLDEELAKSIVIKTDTLL